MILLKIQCIPSTWSSSSSQPIIRRFSLFIVSHNFCMFLECLFNSHLCLNITSPPFLCSSPDFPSSPRATLLVRMSPEFPSWVMELLKFIFIAGWALSSVSILLLNPACFHPPVFQDMVPLWIPGCAESCSVPGWRHTQRSTYLFLSSAETKGVNYHCLAWNQFSNASSSFTLHSAAHLSLCVSSRSSCSPL